MGFIRKRKKWIKLLIKILLLYLNNKNRQEKLTTKSYNEISFSYDKIWSDHMNKFSKEMIEKIDFPEKGKALDLMCGTGYLTGLLSEKMTGDIVGVDISQGMLDIALKKYGSKCDFVCSDILQFLEEQPSNSYDVVVSAWGLGFTNAKKMIKEIHRILKPSGIAGIIDNSLFTVYEVVFSGISTVAEYPSAITNVMNVRWLFSKGSLKRKMSLSGFDVTTSWNGEKTYYAKNGKNAIDFLIKTGTAAGYQFCIDKKYKDIIKERFSSIFEKSYKTNKGLPITHRYIAAIGKKK